MSQPFKLYRLQQIDSAIDQARTRLRKIEAALNDFTAIRQIEEQMTASDTVLTQERKKLRKIDDEVKAQVLKVKTAEASLYGGKVRNPKELQDLEKDVASIRKHISTLEEDELNQMMVVEEGEAAHGELAAGLQEAQNKKATQDSLLRAEQANTEKELARLEHERQAAASGIADDEIQIYEQLRQTRKGLAVAKVAEGTCSACGSTMTPAVAQAAQSSVQLARCSFCGRILYAG